MAKAIVLTIAFLPLTACQTTAAVKYQPPFLPVSFSIDTAGNISIEGDLSLVTPVGTFSVDAGALQSLSPPDGAVLVDVRHRKVASLVDSIYRLETDQAELTVVVDGRTTLQVTNKRVLVDASHGTIAIIQFRQVTGATTTTNPIPLPPALSGAQVAGLITIFYDTKGEFAGQYLILDIQQLTVTQPDDTHVYGCAAYEYAGYYSPDVAEGTDTRQFVIIKYTTGWRLTSMGGNQSCTIDPTNVTAPPPLPTHASPSTSQAEDMVMTYYDRVSGYAGSFVMLSISSIQVSDSVADYVGVRVHYVYATADAPSVPDGTDAHDFALHYGTHGWAVISMD